LDTETLISREMSSDQISQTGYTARILLVEDNDINRQLVMDYLIFSGYEVRAVPSGEMFAQTMAEFQPNLILLDLKLPGLSGYELLTQIQQRPDWQMIPVIVVSAYAFRADQQRALDLGAKQYLVKPIRLTDLLEAIAQELGD
jgi:two-component system cell cycle response regulator DivK